MSPWAVLGVEPGSDRKTIKRAYTRLIKEVQPEDHPEEFMQLREAYEWALNSLQSPSAPRVFSVDQPKTDTEALDIATWDNSDEPNAGDSAGAYVADQTTIEDQPPGKTHETAQPARTISDDWTPNQNIPDDSWGPSQPTQIVDNVEHQQKQLNDLITAMSYLLDNADLRNNLAHWDALINGPEMEDFQTASQVSQWLLSQVDYMLRTGSEQCPLEPQVLIRLNDRFQWTSDHINARIADQDAFRLSLLVDAADQQLNQPPARLGMDWLTKTLYSFSGRLSRIECLVGLASLFGELFLLIALLLAFPNSDTLKVFVITAALVSLYCLTCLMVKRLRDQRVNPLVAIVAGIIFPAAWIVFLLGVPRDNEKDQDPRLKFIPPFTRAYQEHYAGHHDRTVKTRVAERLAGIKSEVYWGILAVWIGGGLLLMA